MVKKSGFSKYGSVIRSMFTDKSGDITLKPEQEKELDKALPNQGKSANEERENVDKLNATERKQVEDYLDLKRKELVNAGKPLEKIAEELKNLEKEYVDWIKGQKKEGQKKRSVIGRGVGKWVDLKDRFAEKRGKAKKFLRGEDVFGEEAGGWMFILLAVLLYMLDIFFRYNGINIQRFMDNLYFTSIESYIGWFFNSIVLTLLIAYYVIYRPDPQEFISWFLVAETLSLIIFMGGMGSALIHLSLVIAFYFLFIRFASKDKASANYIFFFLLAFDFFGFGILAEFVRNPIISNRLIIPIWFYFALIYTHEKERSFWINLVIIIVILMNVFYFVGGINGLKSMSATLTEEEKQEGINFIRTGWDNVKTTFSRAIEGFRADLESQLIYASGGYYKGKVERNKIGPLGVFIDKLKASQPRYYEKENIIIWGTLKALSLGEGVNIKMRCHKKGEEKYATKTTPKDPFTVYSKETRDFECVFDERKFDGLGSEGSGWFFDLGFHTITADAEFNFETLAYLKSYFMDIERKRSMVREGLDPFKEFGIKDIEPVAVYTDGPVIIGMETTSPIIEVGKGIVAQPRIGITLENKEGWEGIIRSLTELVILTPHGIGMDLKDEPCTVKFNDYKIDNCKTDSCVNLAFKPCMEVCNLNKKKDCEKECGKIKKSCLNDCDILFKGDEEGKPYNGYKIDVNAEKWQVLDIFKDIDRYRSFSCRLTVDENVLGSTPLTIQYFRAKARYNYTISKDIDIQIQSEAGTAVKGSKTIDVSEEIKVTGTVPQRIYTIAKTLDYDDEGIKWALGVASVENNFEHCNDKSKTICGKGEIKTSGKGAIGAMQIEMHPDYFDSRGIFKKDHPCSEMSNEDMYILNTNILCGLKILKSKYMSYKGGCKKSTEYTQYSNIKNACDECTDSQGKNYFNYVEWQAAARGFIGWDCGQGADIDYVKKVEDYADTINLDTIKNQAS